MLSTRRAGCRLALAKAVRRAGAPANGFVRGKSAESKSWVPIKQEQMEQAVRYSLVHSLSKESVSRAETIVPWYLQNFPGAYFEEVREETRMEHLKGISALKGISHNQDMTLTLNTKNEENNSNEITVLRTDGRPGVLHQMLSSMTEVAGLDFLHSVRAYETNDASMTLNVFSYGGDRQSATLEDAAHLNLDASMAEYLSFCNAAYIKGCSSRRFGLHRELYEAVKGTDRTEVRIQPSDENLHELTIATSSARHKDLLTKVCGLLSRRDISVGGLNMDMILDPSNPMAGSTGTVCMIRILMSPGNNSSVEANVQPLEGSFNDLRSPGWKELKRSLRRIKWLDSVTLDLALNHCPDLGMERAEILTGLVAMLHGTLSKVDPLTYSRQSMYATIRNPFYTQRFTDIADLFLARFSPANPLSGESFSSQSKALKERISVLTNEQARVILLKMVDAVEHTLRTNMFMPDRCSLAFRVDPALLVSEGQLLPFGALFVHGQGFDGFHNRFSNIARGGLRIVSPTSAEQYAMESSRCYDEVYGLSYAQQLKNKDIPEGGSKAVVLVDLDKISPERRNRVLRKSVRGFTDAVLDLILPSKNMVDHLGFDELIYLGPDEQIIPEDINWIIQQAGVRGYPIPAAFMSSKPLAGINHKEYGVTSEGVAVFLDVALRNNGIDPNNEEFSVKITGGPDGDVAGNLMRILFREYGENVKIVGVADGSGSAEDPKGLPHAELMRLFEAALPIGDMDASFLSSEGAMHLADTEEGIRMRNSMLFRVKADVFVPAGGRPNTVHAENWSNFLDSETGVPSSPLVVEGANIFITPEARSNLFEKAGVMIVKDSSANKCGVITSSYEICASMLLDESEFLEIKEELVQDVLLRLRELARMEAELMFREYGSYKGALPYFSERISQAINRAKEAIRLDLSGMQRGDSTYQELKPLFLEEYLPKKLAEVASDRVDERIPLDYMRNAFASCLASKLLYREGTHFIQAQPTERLAELGREYYQKEQRVQHLLNKVSVADMPEAEKREVLELLKHGGARSSLQV